MKKWYALFTMLAFPYFLGALENSMLNLTLPSGLETKQAQFFLDHRFLGKALKEKPFDNFFGVDNSAFVRFGFRVPIWKTFELMVSRTNNQKEYILGAGYTAVFPGSRFKTKLDVQYFTYRYFNFDVLNDQREKAFFGQLAMEYAIFSERCIPVLNIGYDGSTEKTGLGMGIQMVVSKTVGLIAEYYPKLKKDPEIPQNSFTIGMKIQTYGHHFLFMLGNSHEIGTRRMMVGAYSKDLYLGITIKRLLEF